MAPIRRAEPGAPLWADVRGTGPAVVLLHGQPGSSRAWAAVTPLLVGTCTVIAVDRLGYGRSRGPAGGYEANALALAATLDAAGVDRAVLVGHSWAGGVALTFAWRWPERVAGLVLVSSIGPSARPDPIDRLLGAPLVGEAVAMSTFEAARVMLRRPALRSGLARLLPPSGRATLDVVAGGTRADEGLAIGPAPWRSFLVEQRVFNDGTLPDRLAEITAPCTVLTGTADRIVDPAVSAQLAEAIPGARLVTIPRAGHLLPFDHPGEVADAIRELADPGPQSPVL